MQTEKEEYDMSTYRVLVALSILASLAGGASAQSIEAPHRLGASVIAVQARGCPPGFAKKSPACIPPGQAKKQRYRGYRIGDRVTGDYVIIRDPSRYGLDPDRTYYRIGDSIVLVDRDTREILDFIGAAAALLD